MSKINNNRGSILLDWSTALSLSMTTAMVAVPGLRTFVHESQRSVVVNELQLQFRQAAASASRMGQTITVCASHDGQSCAQMDEVAGSKDWSAGWISFVDLDGDGVMQADEASLRMTRTANDQPNIVVTGTHAAFSFRPYYTRPYAGTEPGRVTVCDREVHGGSRAVILDRNGKGRLGPVTKAKRGCDAQA